MNILLIVDVQKSMGHWFSWSYIVKLERFLRLNHQKYDAVYMIMEPRFSKTESEGSVQFSGTELFLVSDRVPAFFEEYLTRPPLYKAYNKDYWEKVGKAGGVPNANFVTLPPYRGEGRPYKMYLNGGLRKLISLVKNAEKIDIVGGGLTKCVRLTHRLLNFYSIPNTVLSEYCYEIQYVNSNRRAENTFNTKPIASIRKKLLNQDGTFKIKRVPLFFQP